MVKTKIEIEEINPVTKTYHGKVMIWNLVYGWITSGIYVEESTPGKTLKEAIRRAKDIDIWGIT